MKKYLVGIMFLLLVGLVLGVQTTSFSNLLSSEDLDFTGNENITRSLVLPKDAVVSGASLNISVGEHPSLFTYTGENFSVSSVVGNSQANVIIGDYIYILQSEVSSEIYKYYTNGTYTGENFSVSVTNPLYMTSHEEIIYITGVFIDGFVSYYTNGTEIGSFSLYSENTDPNGITTNGDYIWINDRVDDKIYKYYTNGTYTGENFSVSSISNDILDITFYNNYLFLNDYIGGRVYKFELDGAYADEYWEVRDVPYNNGFGRGISNNKTHFFISSAYTDSVYIYDGYNYPNNPYIKIGATNIWNYTGEFTTSQTTNNFSSILNTALNGGDCDCTGCSLNGNDCTINLTFHSDTTGTLQYSNLDVNWTESISPTQTINKPSGEYSTTEIPINITTTENDQLSLCTYWVTRGVSLEIDNTTLTCGEEIIDTLYVSSQFTTYTFHSYIEDRSGNSNYTTSTFETSQNATIITAPSGGGGGSVIVDNGDQTWTMEVANGINKFEVDMGKGSRRTFGIEFENLGDSSQTIKLSCEDTNGTACKYVEFPEDTFELALLKDTKQSVDFIIDIPKDGKEGNYQFNIIAKDEGNKKGAITVLLGVGVLSIIPAFFSKALFSFTSFGLPYALIFFPSLIFGFVLFSRVFGKKIPLRALWILISSLMVSITLVALF